ncbi:hypothetical protein NPIL_614701 [Nephila pilipes]|uniref:Uncharacterized protein n=1 Tax=Nephila pilipes TaxID=299642 RepID=A0A8X6N049_NEPPI|nr:hypothetical protein NPIL_614701 [Nephila pilipes]
MMLPNCVLKQKELVLFPNWYSARKNNDDVTKEIWRVLTPLRDPPIQSKSFSKSGRRIAVSCLLRHKESVTSVTDCMTLNNSRHMFLPTHM